MSEFRTSGHCGATVVPMMSRTGHRQKRTVAKNVFADQNIEMQ
jgi:hypothetical protein